jgi:hypothetical protein
LTAFWAREDTDPESRAWALDQGLRAWKYVSRELGYEMTQDKLAERLGLGSASGASGQLAASTATVHADYDRLLD